MKPQGVLESRRVLTERRQHFRYPISGSFVLEAYEPCECQYIGIPLNLSLGGILLQSDPVPPKGTCGLLHLRLDGFDDVITGEMRVIRISGSRAAAFFFFTPPEVVTYIEMLTALEGGMRRLSSDEVALAVQSKRLQRRQEE